MFRSIFLISLFRLLILYLPDYARTRRACEGLKRQFEARTIERHYLAVAEGCLTRERGRLVSHLAEDPKSLKMRPVRRGAGGKEAITEYRVEERLPSATVLMVRLRTGRKNQIRVQLAEAGHPLVGDGRYGRRSPLIGRMALHARSLEFVHPVTGRDVRVESPIPADLKELIRQLRERAGTNLKYP